MENNSQINSPDNSDELLHLIMQLVKNTPNDQTLGSKMRTLINSINSENNYFNYPEIFYKEEKN